MTKKRLTRPDPLKILSSTSKFLSLSLLITIFFMFKLFLKGLKLSFVLLRHLSFHWLHYCFGFSVKQNKKKI
jgi:hypothetical protein